MLDRLRRPDPSSADWRRLHDLYAPLIRRWLVRAGVGADADDLGQDILLVLVSEVPGFERQRNGSFRTWLRVVTVNRVRTWRRSRARRPVTTADPTEAFLTQLEDPAGNLAQQWDREHNKHVTDKLLALVKPDFTPHVWTAFEELTLARRPAADVATQLGMKVEAVLQAKSRVLRRLRQEAGGLLD